jgi:hypothetical protein
VAVSHARANAAQALLGFVGDGLDLAPADQTDHDLRVEEAHHHAAGRFFAHDHVARQQQSDVRFSLKGLVRQRRVAGAENPLRRHLGTELFLHGALHVDVAQDAEAFDLQSSDGLCERLIEAQARQQRGEAVNWMNPRRSGAGDRRVSIFAPRCGRTSLRPG